MEIWGIGRVMRGFFSGMVRGMSNTRKGSKILTFLFGPRLVCSKFLLLRSSWKGRFCDSFALTAFLEVHMALVLC
jgi:hypothetical protein